MTLPHVKRLDCRDRLGNLGQIIQPRQLDRPPSLDLDFCLKVASPDLPQLNLIDSGIAKTTKNRLPY